MQTPKARTSLEVPQRVSPCAVRQLKTTPSDADSASSSNQATRTPKEKSPKVVERRSPRSPLSEKKRPSRISELESRVSQLQEELKKTKDQLNFHESCKNKALQDAEESKKQLCDISSKLDDAEKRILELSASEESHVTDFQRTSEEREQALLSELEGIQKQQSVDSAALASAVDEIQRLKTELEMVAQSEAAQTKHAESANMELQSLKGNLAETLSLVENMKTQLEDCKESEAQAQALVNETLSQLGTAKATVEALRLDGMKATEAYNSITSELDQSKERVNLLEGLVNKLETDLAHAGGSKIPNPSDDKDLELETGQHQQTKEANQLEEELSTLRYEIGHLRSALEAAESKHREDHAESTVQIKSAYELMEQMKSASGAREAALEAELNKARAHIEDLKAHLMDKETELQGVLEENEELSSKLENTLSLQKESALERELKKLQEELSEVKANLMDKETELQNISEENETMKLELKKRENDKAKMSDVVVAQVEAARAAEREALSKLSFMVEEAEKSNRRAARVTEQLEAAQATSTEMEGELRRLKVQSDQWRKAAEAAAAMLSTGNNGKFMDRTGSLDSSYNPISGRISSPYAEDMDDDMLKKKNGNMLKKIGVLWKKPQK
ncbi:interactor of constitutive active ROPs 3 [Rhodamnia argentea]|uniref:Interactor of constitutive active ROPs 3 n=1 Tax=Rhodamnia argentea TaxID=178133 RepID=A0A8B8QIV6_9MYRT|nr:interactor of constitutive active ROPs 3 [Rhodamnia argentea]XP_048136956.1 interactor of constitutive active ROPs 3 [Rhodamnia argentea]